MTIVIPLLGTIAKCHNSILLFTGDATVRKKLQSAKVLDIIKMIRERLNKGQSNEGYSVDLTITRLPSMYLFFLLSNSCSV